MKAEFFFRLSCFHFIRTPKLLNCYQLAVINLFKSCYVIYITAKLYYIKIM